MVADKNTISTEGLFYSYKNQDQIPVLALDGLNISIQRGEFVAIVGHNGSGKSTFAKHLNAILTPDMGNVFVWGMDTREEDLLYDIRSSTGMVFQNPDNQIVATVVEEDVAFAPENLGVPQAEIRRRVDAALEAVNMTKFKNHATYQLSGGQKQRVAIAGIIAMQPDCIVLDEPTAMLDPVGRREIMSTVHMLNRELGITVILITHHMNEAADADRVVVMIDGKVVMDDKPREVFKHYDELMDAGLSMPQPVELIHILRDAGIEIDGDILTPEECAGALYELLKQNKR